MSLRCIFDCGVPLTDAEAVEHMDGSAHPDCQELAAEQAEEPEPAHPFTVQVLSRPLNLPAIHTWFKGYPEQHDEPCTVIRLDVPRGKAYVTWTPRTLDGRSVVRPSGWVPLDRLTFTGMGVVHHIAAEHALAGAGR